MTLKLRIKLFFRIEITGGADFEMLVPREELFLWRNYHMAKDLPYFKFYSSEWIHGDITLEDLKTQGLFINICSYYWSQECQLSVEKLQKRFKNNKKQIQNLIISEIIYKDLDDIKIKFLDKQWQEREVVKHKNKANGLKGGRPKKTQSVNSGLEVANQTITNKEEKREEEKRKELKNITKKFTAPTVEEVKEYCDKRLNSVDPSKFISHYETSGWMRGKTKIKDWQACVRTWEKNSSNTQAAAKAYYAGHSLSVLTAIVQKMNNHQANTKEIDIFMAASNDGFKPNE